MCFRGSVRLVITQCRFSLLFRLLVHMIPGCEYAVHDILDTNDDVTNENKVIQILSVNLQRSDVNLLWQFCSVCTQSELNVQVLDSYICIRSAPQRQNIANALSGKGPPSFQVQKNPSPVSNVCVCINCTCITPTFSCRSANA